MNTSTSVCNHTADTIVKLPRWILGAVFVYIGLNKALNPVDFLKSVQQYEVFQNHLLLNGIAVILPWFEILCGLLLLAGLAVRGTLLLLILLLVSFTGLVFDRALNVMKITALPFCTVRFDCGCGAGEVLVCPKLIENLCLIILSAGLLVKHCKASRARKSI